MHLINNQTWLDLTPFIDIKPLEENKHLFAYVIAKYPEHIYTSLVGIQNNLFDQSLVELGDFSKSLATTNGIDKEMLIKLDSFPKFYTYCKYSHQVIGLNQAMYIRAMKKNSYGEKHLRQGCIDTPITKEFQFLFDWLDKEDIFDEYGRVLMFLNEPGVETIRHRDYPNPKSHKNEFIWITLNDIKRFYVYDADIDKKDYITSKVAYFDNANWHGSDPMPYANWSLRIDGVFSDNFLNKTSLKDHFRYFDGT